jgi:hypothetical protein
LRVSLFKEDLFMTLSQRLAELVRACFTGIWIESHEHEDALAEIAQLCRNERWPLARWDVAGGLSLADGNAPEDAGSDPLAALKSLPALATGDGASLLVLTNFHRFLNSPEIVQHLVRQITAGKQHRTFVVILAPVVQIPIELEKLFVVLPHELPNREQLGEIARAIATEPGELPQGQDLDRVLDAAAGLTRYEAEGAFSLALIRHGRLQADVLWEQKTQLLKKSGLLSLYRGGDTFSQLGGLDALKAFSLRALRQRASASSSCKARGVMLLGVSGTGKSAFCKALGNETGRPTLVLDVGSLMGSLVGQSEERTRQALRIVEAMAPCVLMVDEIEKALAGVGSSGQTDSGVSARMFGTLLSWLNDHTSDVFVVCTANDVSRLPPEFTRAERFDGVFFLDLPDAAQRAAIWQMHTRQYELDANQRRPDDAQWTGAEIKSCCRLAALLDVPLIQAAQNVVPVAVTAAEAVDRLRTWASGRCLSADQGGLYQRDSNKPSARRRVQRDPSNN